ncbi:Clr5 domain-containing protein [Podospora aff. communis PSN243]|uniref:Clr5 domain-containing protein n=1 Tax=Podospora aff. communis PSN243 TaxID=3040156 RepID=A0AAV9H117_9PEZI|nr:Clr5 domain-containing protein [Podospora aff. communis PSN243]
MTKAWDDYKDAIIGEYKEHNKPLHEVQRIMEEKYRFKASTRAYRSRLDKWGVYKYSCRKRNGSSGANDDGSPDDDTPGLSPPRTPGQQHTSPLSDPECPGTPGPMSPMTPISRDQQLFGAPFSGTTSPSELGR